MKTPRFPLLVKAGSVTVAIYRMRRPRTARQAEREIFTVAWHAGGQRHTRQFADLSRAQDEAKLKAEQLSAGRVSTAATMGLQEFELLKAARELAGAVPLLTALEEWQEGRLLCKGSFIPACRLWAETQTSSIEDVTTASAADQFIAAKRKAGIKTAAGLDRTMPKFKERFGGQGIATITSKDLQAWLDSMDHPSTRNTHRQRIVTFFRWARKVGMLPTSAQTQAEKTDKAREADLDIEILTVPQFSSILQLMRASHPKYLAATVLAGFCGLRRSELHAQAWKDISLERGHLRITAAKSNTPAKRLVPLCPAAVEWLLLCDRTTELVSPPWGMDLIRRYCREAKPTLPCPDNSFRHGFISHRVAQSGDVARTSLEAGNSVRIIHRHYLELVDKKDGEAWFGIRPGDSGQVIEFAAGKQA